MRDKTRKPGKAPTPEDSVRRVVALTCGAPPGEATHWTGRAMAEASGLSLRTVQRIWAAHRLQPHRIRTFKRSKDPDVIANLEEHNADPQPFTGTATPAAIIAKLDQANASVH